DIPGMTHTYGTVNYTMFQTSEKGFVTVRNEVMYDEDGERYRFAGLHSSHTVGYTHNFTPWCELRPEVGYYRNWDRPAFDLGTDEWMWLSGVDLPLRF